MHKKDTCTEKMPRADEGGEWSDAFRPKAASKLLSWANAQPSEETSPVST